MTAHNIPVDKLIALLIGIQKRGYSFVNIHTLSNSDLALQPSNPEIEEEQDRPTSLKDLDLTELI